MRVHIHTIFNDPRISVVYEIRVELNVDLRIDVRILFAQLGNLVVCVLIRRERPFLDDCIRSGVCDRETYICPQRASIVRNQIRLAIFDSGVIMRRQKNSREIRIRRHVNNLPITGRSVRTRSFSRITGSKASNNKYEKQGKKHLPHSSNHSFQVLNRQLL